MELAKWRSSLDKSTRGRSQNKQSVYGQPSQVRKYQGIQVSRHPGTQVPRYPGMSNCSYLGIQVFLYLSYVLFSSQHLLGVKLPFGSSRPFYDLPRPLAPLDLTDREELPNQARFVFEVLQIPTYILLSVPLLHSAFSNNYPTNQRTLHKPASSNYPSLSTSWDFHS